MCVWCLRVFYVRLRRSRLALWWTMASLRFIRPVILSPRKIIGQ